MDLTDVLLEGGTREDEKGVCLPWAPLPRLADVFGAASRLAERGAVIGVVLSADDLAGGFAAAVFVVVGCAEW